MALDTRKYDLELVSSEASEASRALAFAARSATVRFELDADEDESPMSIPAIRRKVLRSAAIGVACRSILRWRKRCEELT